MQYEADKINKREEERKRKQERKEGRKNRVMKKYKEVNLT